MKPKPEPPVDMWEALDAVAQEHFLTRPEGSFTIAEYSQRKKIPYGKARDIIYRLEQMGKVKRYAVVPGSNRVYWTVV